MTWLHKWVISEQWGLSAESRLPWRLRCFVLYKPTQNNIVRCHSIKYFLFSKGSNRYKTQDSSKIFYISFYFSIMGPIGLVCLQLTSTLSAGIPISSLLCALYRTSVNLKWADVVGNEWQRDRNDTRWRLHTHCTICAALSHHPRAQQHVGKGEEWKAANSKLMFSTWYDPTLRIQADHW